MPDPAPTSLEVWKELENRAAIMSRPENHLQHLTAAPGRLAEFSLSGDGIVYDFSRQRVDAETMDRLYRLAGARRLREQFQAMCDGATVNATENRAALHTAARDFTRSSLEVDGTDVLAALRRVRAEIREFVGAVHRQEIVGSTGKPFRQVVVIGIGGSYLGTCFVARALRSCADKNITLRFLANVDIHNFAEITAAVDPEETLWIVVSKSFTTAETMANAHLARQYVEEKGLNPADHFVSITSRGSPGDAPDDPDAFPVRRAFHMFDFIGGRYSVTSAVGGVPLGLYLGYERFEAFLKGAHAMDEHARKAPPEENLPLTAALIGIWNNNFLGYRNQAIIPYAAPLEKLPPHIQQLYMESNGKSVTEDGRPAPCQTGMIVFGEPGTNAQHSFFQLAHQGDIFPIDFIGVAAPQYGQYRQTSPKGVTNHQELWANLISQPKALAEGRKNEDPHRSFAGNRPSSTLILPDLSPESLGRLLAFYEAKTVYEAFVWGINPFDQFGVELGKSLAGDIRHQMAQKNRDNAHRFDFADPIARYYLDMLFG